MGIIVKKPIARIALQTTFFSLILFLVVLALGPMFYQLRTKTLNFTQPVQRALVVFAHPDDEITNAGLIRYLADNGAEINLLTLSDGSANPESDDSACPANISMSECRINELKAAARLLGIQTVITPMLPDSALIHHLPEAIGHISREITALRPDVILTMEPSGLNGQADHRVLFPAVVRSIQQTGHSAQLLLSTLPWPISVLLPSQLPKGLAENARVFPTYNALQRVKTEVADAHKSQRKTIQGLTLGFGPRLLFCWLSFETYTAIDTSQLDALIKQIELGK